LQAQSPVTIEVFETVIVDAIERRDEQINETLARLEQTDLEAAQLMRELREELEEIRRNGAVIDPDTAAMLSGAAYQLQGLPDSAATLSKAADQLNGLPDLVSQLNAAANHLNGLQ
jgi:septation ring formation regulator EzrA